MEIKLNKIKKKEAATYWHMVETRQESLYTFQASGMCERDPQPLRQLFNIRKSWRPWFFQIGLITQRTPET